MNSTTPISLALFEPPPLSHLFNLPLSISGIVCLRLFSNFPKRCKLSRPEEFLPGEVR